jgi:hypothetical protein
MKLKCSDGKVRRFLVCRPNLHKTEYGDVLDLGGLLEAECVECHEKFGCHDTYILKPKFLAHVCAVEHGLHPTSETRPASQDDSTSEHLATSQS